MEYLTRLAHFEPMENAEIAYEDTTLVDFLSTEITIDEALNFVQNVYGTIEPEMIYEKYGSYQELYNEYIGAIAAMIVEEFENCGEVSWYDQNITLIEEEEEA